MTDTPIEAIKSVQAQIALKAGKNTTEFYVLCGVVALMLANNLHLFGMNLATESLITLAGLAAVYIAGRSHIKASQ